MPHENDRPSGQNVSKNFIYNFFVPALRGGFVGLLLGFTIRLLSLRFFPVGRFILGMANGLIIIAIPFLWMNTIDKKEEPIVPYDSDNVIPSPYLTGLSMAYFTVILEIFIK